MTYRNSLPSRALFDYSWRYSVDVLHNGGHDRGFVYQSGVWQYDSIMIAIFYFLLRLQDHNEAFTLWNDAILGLK